MNSYILSGGHCGIGIACISYGEYLPISCVVDDSITKDPQRIIDLLQQNIKKCLEYTKSLKE